MSFEGTDFGIVWSSRIPPTNKRPATVEEINEMMDKIRDAALKTEPGGHISIEGRMEVINAVEIGIEADEQGFCLKDFGTDGPKFDPQRGEYVSELRIFPNEDTQNEWLNKY